MDYEYTNNVENKLDEISTGKIEWTKVVGDEYNDFMPIVKKLNDIKKDINKNMFFVGKHPETDEDINAYIGKYGPVLRIGNNTNEDNNKYRYVSLDKNTVITNLTIKKILRLIRYPLNLGEYNDKEIVIKNGPYGKYIVYDGKNYSLSKYDNVNESLDFAIKVVSGELDKKLGFSNTILKKFENDDKIIIKNGRYGPYICKMPSKKGIKPINAKIPKNMLDKIDEITLEKCRELIDKHYSNPSTFNFKKRRTKYKK
jgi:DNA topoisomerase-1